MKNRALTWLLCSVVALMSVAHATTPAAMDVACADGSYSQTGDNVLECLGAQWVDVGRVGTQDISIHVLALEGEKVEMSAHLKVLDGQPTPYRIERRSAEGAVGAGGGLSAGFDLVLRAFVTDTGAIRLVVRGALAELDDAASQKAGVAMRARVLFNQSHVLNRGDEVIVYNGKDNENPANTGVFGYTVKITVDVED